jgi:hypothetical protein
MGILYLVFIAIIGAVGAVIGAVIGFARGFGRAMDPANHDMTAVTGTLPFIQAFFGSVAGGSIGLFVGTIILILFHKKIYDPFK